MRLGLLIRKNLLRRRLRTLLTLLGLACAVGLFVAVEALNDGLDAALGGDESRRTLVVYRQNRYCPQTSNLPEYYSRNIEDVPGVESVLPVKVFLNNCRASLDMVTFQGAPVEAMLATRNLDMIDGDPQRFRREPDSAIVGRGFARRRGLSVGDSFRMGSVNVKIAGIFRSPDALDEEVIFTHLEFLQRAGDVNRLGTVTQFEVRVTDQSRADEVARAIDDLFATSEEPTDTRPKSAFLETATRDLREILGFGRLFGLSCALVALALMAGTVVMSVQERYRELGVFRTLGYRAPHLFSMVLGESVLLALVGGLVGIVGAVASIQASSVAVGVEGVQIGFLVSPILVVKGLGMAFGCAVLAGLAPAFRAARVDVVQALRST